MILFFFFLFGSGYLGIRNRNGFTTKWDISRRDKKAGEEEEKKHKEKKYMHGLVSDQAEMEVYGRQINIQYEHIPF